MMLKLGVTGWGASGPPENCKIVTYPSMAFMLTSGVQSVLFSFLFSFASFGFLSLLSLLPFSSFFLFVLFLLSFSLWDQGREEVEGKLVGTFVPPPSLFFLSPLFGKAWCVVNLDKPSFTKGLREGWMPGKTAIRLETSAQRQEESIGNVERG